MLCRDITLPQSGQLRHAARTADGGLLAELAEVVRGGRKVGPAVSDQETYAFMLLRDDSGGHELTREE